MDDAGKTGRSTAYRRASVRAPPWGRTSCSRPDGDLPAFTTGSPGGNAILAYTAKSIVGMIDWGLDAHSRNHRAAQRDCAKRHRPAWKPRACRRKQTDEVQRAGPAQGIRDGRVLSSKVWKRMGHEVVRSRGEISGLHIIQLTR